MMALGQIVASPYYRCDRVRIDAATLLQTFRGTIHRRIDDLRPSQPEDPLRAPKAPQ